jgi:hypothetical protein
MTDGERIRRLEDENARLRRVAEAAGVPSFAKPDMPTAIELKYLHTLVTSKYPQLAPATYGHFELALLAIAFFRRSPKLNALYFPSYWCDAAKDLVRRQGYPSNISLHAFTAAAIVAGVAHSMSDRFPYDLEFGFTLGGAPKPTNGWRQTLETGKLQEPSPLMRPLPEMQPICTVERDDDASVERSSDVRIGNT